MYFAEIFKFFELKLFLYEFFKRIFQVGFFLQSKLMKFDNQNMNYNYSIFNNYFLSIKSALHIFDAYRHRLTRPLS